MDDVTVSELIMSLTSIISAFWKAFQLSSLEQAYADLMVLDDHALADIGLSRSEVITGLCGTAQRSIQAQPRHAVADEYFRPL